MIRLLLIAAFVIVFASFLILFPKAPSEEVRVVAHDPSRDEVHTPTIPATTTTTSTSVPVAHVKVIERRPRSAPKPAGDVWAALASCETGGRMDRYAYNPAGPYYSYFQFDADSWRRAGGGPGLPWDYSYEEQKRVAQNWQRLVGWSAWPHCSRKVGDAA